MCLAIPGSVESIYERDGTRWARVASGGAIREACLAALPRARVGDFVLVHVGFALSIVDPEQARRTWEALDALDPPDELEAPVGGEVLP